LAEVTSTFSNGSSNLTTLSRGALLPLQTVNTDCAAAASRLVHNGQACGAMLLEFPACFFNRLAHTTTRRRGPHNLFDANVRSAQVVGRYAATHVTFGNNAYQLELFCILNHRRAAAA
jgi:hypothetical protein